MGLPASNQLKLSLNADTTDLSAQLVIKLLSGVELCSGLLSRCVEVFLFRILKHLVEKS